LHFLSRLRHFLAFSKPSLILGIPCFLAFILVAVFLPIVPANEEVPAVAAGHHNARQSSNP